MYECLQKTIPGKMLQGSPVTGNIYNESPGSVLSQHIQHVNYCVGATSKPSTPILLYCPKTSEAHVGGIATVVLHFSTSDDGL